MTAEDIKYSQQRIELSIPIGKTIDLIINSFKENTPNFKKHITKFNHKILNEEELTQEFVALLRRKTADFSFLIGQEKKDLYQYSKGRADFYFYWKEETSTTESFFDIEAKIMTDRFSLNREKEYVIGEKKNGGIERFKIERHGKGLNQCGLLGFIENSTTDYWIETINNWIVDLSNSDSKWHSDEKLIKIEESFSAYVYLTSFAERVSSDRISLHHYWIQLTSY